LLEYCITVLMSRSSIQGKKEEGVANGTRYQSQRFLVEELSRFS